MRILLANYTGDRANWGCQATSRNLLGFLKKSLSAESDLEIYTTPFPRGHAVDNLFDIVYGDRIKSIFTNPQPSLRELEFLEGLTRERFGKAYDVARQADVVVFQGEGNVGSSAHYRNPNLFGIPFLAARLWQKPVLSLNQTIYARSHEERDILRSIYGCFRLVAVRELASYLFVKELGIEHALLCPDMAFGEFTASPTAALTPPEGTYFCVTGSTAVERYDMKSFADLVGTIAERHQLKPLLMFSRKKDRALVSMAEAKLGVGAFEIVSSAGAYDFENILPILRSAKFVLGGRYHTAISALTETTPVILLPADTFKSEGLGSTIGLDLPVFRIEEKEAIMAAVAHILSNEQPLREKISRAVDRARQTHRYFSTIIRDLARNPHSVADIVSRADSRIKPALDSHGISFRNDVTSTTPKKRITILERWLSAIRLSMSRRKSGYCDSIDATLIMRP